MLSLLRAMRRERCGIAGLCGVFGVDVRKRLWHSDVMDAIEVIGMLNRAVRDAGSQKAFAERCGVSQQFLHDVLNARRMPSEKILSTIGVKKVIRFVRIK